LSNDNDSLHPKQWVSHYPRRHFGYFRTTAGCLLRTPLGGNAMDFLADGKGLYPHSLKRKVTVITDTICFAFAGRVKDGESLLEDLRVYCKSIGIVTRKQLVDFLEAYDTADFDPQFEFCMVVVEQTDQGNEATILNNENCMIKEAGVFGQLCLLGSGAAAFWRTAQNVVWEASTIPQSPVGYSQVDDLADSFDVL